jgi:hypothetical protein
MGHGDRVHLAQLNVGRLRAPMDDPSIDDFRDNLEPINALAEGRPGFVWRLQDESGNATGIKPYGDELEIVNLTVWESIEALSDFAYRSDHKDVMRRRREWFLPMEEAYLALWWVPVGHRPSVAEAEDRLRYLRTLGPTPEAFTFRDRFPPRDTFNYLTQSSKSA